MAEAHHGAEETNTADAIVLWQSSIMDAYVVAEESVTIDEDDIERAHRRVVLIRKATGAGIHGAVIRAHILAANRQNA